jgi:hypothetical protein
MLGRERTGVGFVIKESKGGSVYYHGLLMAEESLMI